MADKKQNAKPGVVDVEEIATELVIKEERSANLIQAVDIAGYNTLMQVSSMLANSPMFKGSGGAAGIFATVLYGHEHGIQPMTALSVIHVIQGNFGFSAQFIQAKLERSGVIIDVVDSDENVCHLKFSGRKGKVDYISEFTMDDAKQAGFAGKDNYKKSPKDMLYARALTRGARRYSPAAILGMYDYAEIEVMGPKDKPASIGTLSASQMAVGDPSTVIPYDKPVSEEVDTKTGEIKPTETPETPHVHDEECKKGNCPLQAVAPEPEPSPEPPSRDEIITSIYRLEEANGLKGHKIVDYRMKHLEKADLGTCDLTELIAYECHLSELPQPETSGKDF